MQLRRLTMGALFNDFLHDLTDLDSRVWRTLIALLTKPGKLTNEFIAGRRTLYYPDPAAPGLATRELKMSCSRAPGQELSTKR
jgi:hypothetical protein